MSKGSCLVACAAQGIGVGKQEAGRCGRRSGEDGGGSGSHLKPARLGLIEELEKLELWQNSKVR